jgi:hypothetical protein
MLRQQENGVCTILNTTSGSRPFAFTRKQLRRPPFDYETLAKIDSCRSIKMPRLTANDLRSNGSVIIY